VTFRPGLSLFEQVIYATKKAMVTGQLRPGEPFPSVRVLSRELRINPNTAHKIVAYLVHEGFLETRPGIGTVVAELPDSSRKARAELLGPELERLVVEARRMGVGEEEVTEAVRTHWGRLNGTDSLDRTGTKSGEGRRGR
jgi:GntR family transcriptional regulator